jgi:hypothetical protein
MNYTDLKKEIDKYYDLSYDDVNYGGPLGLFSTFYHKALEKFTNSDKNYEKVLEVGGERTAFKAHPARFFSVRYY